MIIRQLSIFLENRTGRINEVARILADNGINMQAFSMAETADFGLLRLIVPDVERAVEVLRQADIAVMLTDVLCVNIPNVPGALSAILEKLASNGIFIEYMYAFSDGEYANVVIRPDNIEEAVRILE
ncbi:MAG: ACT domain-containing protein [Bacteroidales bacterium]|jgi:hypothetical protein|nr:ACT domain-containing protein [Bacteroidales bacterium]